MKIKRMLPLLTALILTFGCALPTAVTPTAAVVPTLDTETPGGSPATLTPATLTPATLPATDTPAGEPPTATAPPPQGPTIPHLTAGTAIKLTAIQMIDASIGWGIGGLNGSSDHIFHTSDGGVTWQDITPPEPLSTDPGSKQNAIGYFRDASSGWAAFSTGQLAAGVTAYIWSTQDGGASWQPAGLTEPALSAEAYVPSDLFFVDASNGWMIAHVGAGMNHDYVVLLSSADGGASWSSLIDPQTDGGIQSCAKTDLAFATDQIGWLAMDCRGVVPIPFIFKTVDGGANWATVELPEPTASPGLFNDWYCGVPTFKLFSTTAGSLLLNCTSYAGSTPSVKSFLYVTADGGTNWSVHDFPATGMEFIDPQNGFGLGHDIYKSVDGGANWTKVKTVNWDGQFSFVDTQLVWAVARSGNQIALVNSVNGGASWQEIKPKVGP